MIDLNYVSGLTDEQKRQKLKAVQCFRDYYVRQDNMNMALFLDQQLTYLSKLYGAFMKKPQQEES